MKEQPQQQSSEDLFEWGETNKNPLKSVPEPVKTPEKHKKDDLGWNCAQCELNNGWCNRHPRSQSTTRSALHSSSKETDKISFLSEEELRLSEQSADFEIERQRLEEEANRLLTPEEVEKFFEELNEELFGKKAS